MGRYRTNYWELPHGVKLNDRQHALYAQVRAIAAHTGADCDPVLAGFAEVGTDLNDVRAVAVALGGPDAAKSFR